MTGLVCSLALAAILAGGTLSPTGASTSADTPVSAPATTDRSDSKAELREPEEGLVDVYDRPFDRHKARGRKVTLFYVSGLDECYGLDRIKVRERRRKVVLTIFEGTHPDVDACPDVGVFVKSIARLKRPLGDRRVVDGSR